MEISIWQIGARGLLALACLLLVVACSTQQPPPPAIVPPPVPSPAPPPQTKAKTSAVRASFQGQEEAGKITASGERFDPNELTAASKTLPLGSRVLVTNPANGKSVIVRINDRGPYVRGRSLDLSERAAEELGITDKGVARLKIKRLDAKPAQRESLNSPPESATPSTP